MPLLQVKCSRLIRLAEKKFRSSGEGDAQTRQRQDISARAALLVVSRAETTRLRGGSSREIIT